MAKSLSTPKVGNVPKLNFAVYGEGGSGKSTLLKGFDADPRTGPALWIDVLGNPYLFAQDLTFGMELETWDDILEPVDFLRQGQPARHPFRKRWDIPKDLVFKSLVVDTFSSWQQLLIDFLVSEKPVNKGKMRDIVKVDARTHGNEIAGTTLSIIRQILTVPVHTLVSYQLQDKLIFSTNDGKSISSVDTKQEIALYGSSRTLIPPWHNLMGALRYEKFTKTEEVTKRGRTVEKPVVYTANVIRWRDTDGVGKNQVAPSLGEELVEPTAAKILDAIEQHWNNS